MINTNYLLFALLGLALSLSTGFLFIKFKIFYHLTNTPRPDRYNPKSKPLTGGIIMLLTWIIMSVLLSYFGFLKDFGISNLVIYMSISLMFILGLLDDIYKIKGKYKIISQILVGILLVNSGLMFKVSTILIINQLLTILWFCSIVNFVNMQDNIDGLAGMLSLITLIGIWIINPSQQILVLGSIIVGFLFFNLRNSKIFMGDNGSMWLGSLLAISAISQTSRLTDYLPILLPLTLLAIPIIDAVVVVFARIKHHKNIFSGGADHASHRLVSLGLSSFQSVLVLSAVALVGTILVYFGNNIQYHQPTYLTIYITICLVLNLLLYSKTNRLIYQK